LLLEQGSTHTVRRAARPDQQNALTVKLAPEIVGQVAHETGSIGVVADDAAAAKRQRVCAASALGTVGSYVR